MTENLGRQTGQRKMAVGLFRDRTEAARAIEALLHAGFLKDRISVVMRKGEEAGNIADETGVRESYADEGGLAGMGIGGAVGGAAGLLAGLGLLAIPGIGPLLAAGPIAAALSGMAGGGAAGGVIGTLAGSGIPEDEAAEHVEKVNQGNILVAAECGDECDRAESILREHGAINLGSPVSERTRTETTLYTQEQGTMSSFEERGTQTQQFDIQKGWDVYAADGKKIGDVLEIHKGTAAEPGYFVVQKGLLFIKDLYIPFDQVDRIEQDQVFLRCVSDTCDRMDWGRPPLYTQEYMEQPMTGREETYGQEGEHPLLGREEGYGREAPPVGEDVEQGYNEDIDQGYSNE